VSARILLVADPPRLRRRLKKILDELESVVDTARGKPRLWERLAREPADLVIVSSSVAPQPLENTVRLVAEAPEAPGVVVVTDRDEPEERARLLAAGCAAVLYTGLEDRYLRDILEAILEQRRERQAERLMAARPGSRPRLSDFVSASPAMQAFMGVVERVVESNASLLIQGETGVGKERLARAIHAESRRSEGPFVAVNAGALPESLLESELFGHEEGAFTGATRARRGWFELAHGGTVFLDEIAEMPLHLQVTLLRVLQDKEIQRIGGERTVPVDARLMAATNRDLVEAVESGAFRRDLFYRLSVITLTLPPLRERRQDIASLAENYVEYFCTTIGREIDGIAPEALQALVNHDWPGNVRELANVIERAVLLCNADRIGIGDLPETLRGPWRPDGSPFSPAASLPGEAKTRFWVGRPLPDAAREVLGNFEKDYLETLLAETRGRIGETARRAGVTPRTLYNKMEKYGLKKEDFKQG